MRSSDSEGDVTELLPLPPLVAERLGALRERPIEPTEKGFGALRGRASAASLAAARPLLAEAGLVYPLLTVNDTALRNNLAAMAAYCAGAPGREVSTAGWQITELNDQHAYLRLDADAALAPGDLVALGISHPCTTLDKWRALVVLDDDDLVIDTVHSFF